MKAIILSLLLTLSITTAQTEPDPSSFFPSAVGNVWEYRTQNSTYKSEITRDSIGTDNSRFLFYASYFNSKRALHKIDTLNNVYTIHASIDTILYHYYKLDAELGETWKVRKDPPGTLARVDKIYTANIFGEERCIKEIGYYRPPPPFEDTTITEDAVYESYTLLVSGIGEFYEFDLESGPVRVLQGCIIDGDTLGVITSVKDNNNDILPNDIALFQNYPNPFNPATNIEYAINYPGNVNLTVYDVLGRKVTTLVNEYQSTGTYQVQFSVKDNQLSSGIYLYRLTINNTTRTKKMILQK